MSQYLIGAAAALVILGIGAYAGFVAGLGIGRREGAFMLAMWASAKAKAPEAPVAVEIDPSEVQ